MCFHLGRGEGGKLGLKGFCKPLGGRKTELEGTKEITDNGTL